MVLFVACLKLTQKLTTDTTDSVCTCWSDAATQMAAIKVISKFGSSVVAQWARYPEVAGLIPTQTPLFKNFLKISWE